MSKIPFTDEQIKLLKDNPYTYNVTPNQLFLTREFKDLFYKEHQSGKTAMQILEEHGYPADVLGESRIAGINDLIRRAARRKEGFSEGKTHAKSKAASAKESPEAALRRLQHEVDYLRQEVEFLKKISSIRNTRK